MRGLSLVAEGGGYSLDMGYRPHIAVVPLLQSRDSRARVFSGSGLWAREHSLDSCCTQA